MTIITSATPHNASSASNLIPFDDLFKFTKQFGINIEHITKVVLKNNFSDAQLNEFKMIFFEQSDHSLYQVLFWEGICEEISSVVRNLLESEKVDVDAFVFSGQSALHVSCEEGNLPIVELLLQAGANCQLKDENGMTPLHLAVKSEESDIVRLLIKEPFCADIEAENLSGQRAIHLAAMSGNLLILRNLLERGANLNAVDSGGANALHLASHFGYELLVEELLKVATEMPQFVDYRNPIFYNRLHRLPAPKAVPNCPLPLNSMSLVSSQAISVEQSASIWLRQPLSSISTNKVPIPLSSIRKKVTSEPASIQISPLIHCITKNGLTALHIAANGGNTSVCRILLKYGANIDGVTCDGRKFTPLHGAVFNGHLTTIKLLIQVKKEKAPVTFLNFINAVDSDSQSPFSYACLNGHVSSAKFLLENGADIGPIGMFDLEILGNPKILKIIFDAMESDELNGYLGEMLIFAVNNKLAKTVEFLLSGSYGVSFESKSAAGSNPLHFAALHGDLATLEVLLKFGADLEATNKDLNNPLHIAAALGHDLVVDCLIKYKKEKDPDHFERFIHAVNSKSRTAFSLACLKGHISTARLLEASGAFLDPSFEKSKSHLSNVFI